MELIFAKTKWEAWDEPLPRFLERAAAAGFTATEIFIPSQTEAPEEIARAHAAAGLQLVAQIVTTGDAPADHARSLEERYLRAIACKPLLVDCHTGDDAFSFEENLALFAQALELERIHGVPLCHELHRGRALYQAPDTLRFLQALPSLRINADFSHWQVVHESDDLKKHAAAVEAVIAASYIGTPAALDAVLGVLDRPMGEHLTYAVRTALGSEALSRHWKNSGNPKIGAFMDAFARAYKRGPFEKAKTAEETAFDKQPGVAKTAISCVRERIISRSPNSP